MHDREAFVEVLRGGEADVGAKLTAGERKAVLSALGKRDPEAEVCRDGKGNPEPDPELRDTETVPLSEDVDAYIAHEVLPHVPNAWVDASKTKVGYEIPLNRHFYVYEPPRPHERSSRTCRRWSRRSRACSPMSYEADGMARQSDDSDALHFAEM